MLGFIRQERVPGIQACRGSRAVLVFSYCVAVFPYRVLENRSKSAAHCALQALLSHVLVTVLHDDTQ